jgi:hypothetical protein
VRSVASGATTAAVLVGAQYINVERDTTGGTGDVTRLSEGQARQDEHREGKKHNLLHW